jgi:hypothetical protein
VVEEDVGKDTDFDYLDTVEVEDRLEVVVSCLEEGGDCSAFE